MCTRRLLLPLFLVLLAPACAAFGSSQGEPPMRSPTLDYPEPPVETADGQILGADGMRVEDKLRTSPRIGSGGVTPAEAPASIEKRRPEPASEAEDPICEVLGVRRAVLRERCPGRTTPNL
jgi:hypothetical protein